MSTAYGLTPRAAADIDLIADYTIETWGLGQLETYLQFLHNSFEWLADNPFADRDRKDLHPGYRSYPGGRHLIFYIVNDDHVDIIGIPHKSKDLHNRTGISII